MRPVRTKTMNRKHSIRRKITGIILACWMIPVLLMLGVVGAYMTGNYRNTTAEHIRDQLSFNLRLLTERLDGAVRLSRQASYDGRILEILRARQEGSMTESTARRSCSEYLQSVYGQNEMVSMAVLFFPDSGEESGISVYSDRAGGSYAKLRGYWNSVHRQAAAAAESLGTAVAFLSDRGELYLLRNLVDSHFRTKASLVLCLNTAYCFESLVQFPAMESACLWLGDTMSVVSSGGRFSDVEAASSEAAGFVSSYERCGEDRYSWQNGQLAVSGSSSGEGYRVRLVVFMQQEVTKYPFYGYPFIMGGIALGALLLLVIMIRYFNREVAAPVSAISRAAQEIEKGHLGVRAELSPDNLEFQYITDSFNSMSDRLKQQFDRIYEEEIALREARIKSLQSNINPHFLNNTLEAINWEARLAGNDKVSGMIEALSVVLDASLDRRKLPMVSLREEMGYVSAYLYIMRERFGDRLTVENDIPEELLDMAVPRLILQPVIENAIEHGAARSPKGSVRLSGKVENGYLILDVENDGTLDESDRRKIAKLLAADEKETQMPPQKGQASDRDSSGHIGIANVNQRLKILFGEPCGLTITPSPAGTLARLTISQSFPEAER